MGGAAASALGVHNPGLKVTFDQITLTLTLTLTLTQASR